MTQDIKTIERIFYIAFDGTEFDTKEECLKYEKESKERQDLETLFNALPCLHFNIADSFIEGKYPKYIILSNTKEYNIVKSYCMKDEHGGHIEEPQYDDKYPMIAYITVGNDPWGWEVNNLFLYSVNFFKKDMKRFADSIYSELERLDGGIKSYDNKKD